MREEIEVLAGPRSWGDTRESWLSRVPRTVKRILGTEEETVSCRMVKALWYGEIRKANHHAARDVRRAAEIMKARQEVAKLATVYGTIAEKMRNAAHSDETSGGGPNQLSADIARLERVARLLGGGDRT